jgi:hypothetical protein
MELNNFIWNNFKQTADYQHHRQALLMFIDFLKRGDLKSLEKILSDKDTIIDFRVDANNFEDFRFIFEELDKIHTDLL